MSNEEVKQEGEFKLKKRKSPKKLATPTDNVVKVNMKEPLIDLEPEVKKVVIKNEDNAVQAQETNDSNAIVEEPKDSGNSEEVVKEVRNTEETVESPIQLVTEEEEKEEVKEVTQEYKEAVRDEKVLGKPLPENIEKLVSFMEDTGGSIEDYVRLNADYSNIDNNALLREYYKQSKPYLEGDDINLLLEDFSYDEDIDEPRDIRKKKLAFKEEVAKARNFLEQTNRYNEEQKAGKAKHSDFLKRTSELLNDDFKGFDFNIGESKFRYSVKNPTKVAEAQSDISTFIKTFLNEKGEVKDTKGYHKALYAARNADTIASHFYEQGKADAIKDVTAKSKNISKDARAETPGDVFINGWKVKAVSGVDSSKLKVKYKK